MKTYLEFPIEVEYDYTEGQKLITRPNDRAQEGIDPSIELTSITCFGVDIPIDNLTEDQETELINEAWKDIHTMAEDYEVQDND